MRLRDELGTLFADELFTPVYASEGQPALHPWQLALVSVMQFAENLSDRQAADAVRARIDWKYALGLELSDEGFHSSAASGLGEGSLEQLLGLERCRERCWLKVRGRQRTDSTHVVGGVRALNQLELVGETLRATLNVLATVAPEWLKEQVPPDWYERYGERIEDYRLPKDQAEREALASASAMATICSPVQRGAGGMDWLKQVPAVQTLEQIWAQQYRLTNGHALRLTPQEWPPVCEWLRSPYDRDVRDSAQAESGGGGLQSPCDRRL
jgi:transposase